MTASPKASLVIPLLRQEDAWLDRCVGSALAQTVPVEVLVVLSPETPARNRALRSRIAAGAGDRLAVLEQPPADGFAAAVNAGFARAAADRVGLLLSDEWLEPRAVEVCLGAGTEIVATGQLVHDAGEAELRTTLPDRDRYHALPTLEAKARYLEHFFLFQKAALVDVGGGDETIGSTGPDDYDLIWCLLERGARVTLIPEALKSRWFGEPVHVARARIEHERAIR